MILCSRGSFVLIDSPIEEREGEITSGFVLTSDMVGIYLIRRGGDGGG